jgi:hypothetical protein
MAGTFLLGFVLLQLACEAGFTFTTHPPYRDMKQSVGITGNHCLAEPQVQHLCLHLLTPCVPSHSHNSLACCPTLYVDSGLRVVESDRTREIRTDWK